VTPQELIKELESGHVRPAYLLAGSEALLRDDALAELRARLLDGRADDFNFDRLDGTSTTPAALEDLLRALPVMATRRLVVLYEPDPARGASRPLLEALPGLIGSLREQSGCVLVVVAARPDGRARWVKAFGEPAVRIDCEPPRAGRELVAFVKSEARRQSLKLAPAAADLLAERVGPQLMLLRQEIAKLALSVEPGASVEPGHVEISCGQVAEEPIWDLTDAIGEGRTADSIALLSRLLEGGAVAPQLLGVLASHFRKLARVAGGGRPAGPPFVQRKLASQASRYKAARLLECLRAIQQADLGLKGAGSLSPELVIERLVIGLAS
jgi:DNA polymerase-3 subunit delta